MEAEKNSRSSRGCSSSCRWVRLHYVTLIENEMYRLASAAARLPSGTRNNQTRMLDLCGRGYAMNIAKVLPGQFSSMRRAISNQSCDTWQPQSWVRNVRQ